MRERHSLNKRCTYVVRVGAERRSEDDLRELARYLSTLGTAGCEVVILDSSPRPELERRSSVLRWVGRHLSVRDDDSIRAAATFAACENVIVASEDVRYSAKAIGEVCDHLRRHEVIVPQDYLDPMPWWGGIETSRMLVHRAIELRPDHGATFAFRRGTGRGLRELARLNTRDAAHDQPLRRLAAVGADVFTPANVFVRRETGPFAAWLAQRPRIAGNELVLPVKTAFFLALIPFLLVLALLGGARMALGYSALIAFSTTALALRGRGRASAFPLRACFFAPLWIIERSVSVYWALFRKLRGSDVVTAREDIATADVTTTANHG
jgi:hypothetical protein